MPSEAIRLERLRDQWPKLVSPRVARRTWPARLFRGQLWVNVHDNQWLHELGYLRQEILDRLHRERDFEKVNSIELRLGSIPPAREAPPLRPEIPPPPPLPSEPEAATVDALEGVRDPQLRAAMAAAREALARK